MATTIQFGGQSFNTYSKRGDGDSGLALDRAARAWAETALPDTSVIDASEDAAAVADALEEHWWTEARGVLHEGIAESGVEESVWRATCRKALVARIERSRPAKVIATRYVPSFISGDLYAHLVGGITEASYPYHDRYLAEDGTWTTSAQEARQFDSERLARAEATRVAQTLV